MQRPKCKQHVKVRRLRQIAAAIDLLGELGFDDLGDGALINAVAEAMKAESRSARREAFADIYETVDLFERLVRGEVVDLEGISPGTPGASG
jgi:hypothetical protein